MVLRMYWDAPIISFRCSLRDKGANITAHDPGADCYKCVPPYDCIRLLHLDEAAHGFEY